MALKIEKETAKKLYSNVPEWYQKEMVAEFGEEFFKEECYESIKTFDDACTELDVNPGLVFNDLDSPDEVAYKKLKVIAKAINQGWSPDWSDADQYKYYPYFKVLSSGFGFSGSDCGYAGTYANVGSRLCFESREKSDYAAAQFIDLYKQFLL